MDQSEIIIKSALQHEIKRQTVFVKDGESFYGQVTEIHEFSETVTNTAYCDYEISEANGKWSAQLRIIQHIQDGEVENAYCVEEETFSVKMEKNNVKEIHIHSPIKLE